MSAVQQLNMEPSTGVQNRRANAAPLAFVRNSPVTRRLLLHPKQGLRKLQGRRIVGVFLNFNL